MATGQIVPNFILQVGQRPLQDQQVTLAVLVEGVFSRSSGPGCAWRSGQWWQGPRRSEVRGDHICFGACGWEVRGTLRLAGAGGRLCCLSGGVSPVSRVNQGCEQGWFLSLPQPPAVSPSGRLHWVSHSFLFMSRPKECHQPRLIPLPGSQERESSWPAWVRGLP